MEQGVDQPDEDAALPVRRVVVIDPREERRAITSLLLERSPRLEVVGSASNLAEARPSIREGHADVALVEIKMPVVDGLAAIGDLRAEFPTLGIVVSSFHDTASDRAAALERGADAYLRKPLDLDDLLALADRRVEPREP
jgi:DNA-binding NarL/FixJ family response regulator